MKAHDRLRELLKEFDSHPEKTCPQLDTGNSCDGCKYFKKQHCDIDGRRVDFLLANQVIALPDLKYRQTVYMIYEGKVHPLEVTSYMIRPEFNNLLQIHLYKNGFNGCCTADDFGETVFLTKEETQKALQGNS